MPRALVLSLPARRDLDHIYDQVSRHNESAANDLIDELWKSVSFLLEHPQLGRVYRKHRRRTLRLLPHGDYLIFYCETPPVVEIARIIHGAQNVPDILRDLLD